MQFDIFGKIILSDNPVEAYYDLLSEFDELFLDERQLFAYVEVYEKNQSNTEALIKNYFDDSGIYDPQDLEKAKKDAYKDEDVISLAYQYFVTRKCEEVVSGLSKLWKELDNKRKEWKSEKRIPSGIIWAVEFKKLRALFDALIKYKYLDKKTSFYTFSEAFSNQLTERINWNGSLTSLAYFLQVLSDNSFIKERSGKSNIEDASTFLYKGKKPSSHSLGVLKRSRKRNRDNGKIDSILSKIP